MGGDSVAMGSLARSTTVSSGSEALRKTGEKSPPNRYLRNDLRCEPVPGRRPAMVLVVDEWSGRFFRVRESVWKRLTGTDQPPTATDIALADCCGWTRQRTNPRSRSGGSGFRWSQLLAYQIPIGSADWLARQASGIASMIFSPTMMLGWIIAFVLTLAIVLGQIERFADQVSTLPVFLLGNGKWIAMASLFVTKLAHEWGHAVMCVRIGAKPKTFGVMLFFAVPCPYCDVTDSYRSPSRISRIAVMSAGIYVECVIATIAAWIWMASTDPMIQSTTLNLMLMCGISTFVFNGNPLARYDGYFILSDIVGSVHLRADAKDRFARCATASWRQWKRTDVLGAAFHLSSQAYRFFLLGSLAMAAFAIATAVNAQRPFVAAVVMVAAASVLASFERRDQAPHQEERGGAPVRRGRRGRWIIRSVVLMLVLFVPLPDSIRCRGIVELNGASEVFVPFDAKVESVDRVWGQPVEAGQRLAKLRSSELEHSRIQLASSLEIDRTREVLLRQASIRSDAAAAQWASIEASKHAREKQLASIHRRLSESELSAPTSGRVVSPRVNNHQTHSQTAPPMVPTPGDLHCMVDTGQPWCRVAAPTHLVAELRLPQHYRSRLRIGSPICVSIEAWRDDRPHAFTVRTTIESVSLVASGDASVSSDLIHRDLLVTCRLMVVQDESAPDSVASQSGPAPWWTMLGTTCRGSVKQPWRSVAQRVVDGMGR